MQRTDTSIHDIWFGMTQDEKFQFISENINIKTSKGDIIPVVLADFQKKWFLDGPLFHDFMSLTKYWNRVLMKGRGVGASYVLSAVELVLCSWIYNNSFFPIVAGREEQAVDLIKFCKEIIEFAKFTVPLKVPLKDQSSLILTFANGSEIKAYPGGNPDGIRGRRSFLVTCFPYDEKIITDVGEIPIGDVVELGKGKKVLSYNHHTRKFEWKKILKRFKNEKNDDLININDKITCTRNHPFFDGEKYIEAEKLKIKDKIYKIYNNSLIYEEIHSKIIKTFGRRDANNLWEHIGRRGDIKSESGKSEEKRVFLYVWESETSGIYDVENEDDKFFLPKDENGKIWIYRRDEYNTNHNTIVSDIDRDFKRSSSRERKKEIRRMDNRRMPNMQEKNNMASLSQKQKYSTSNTLQGPFLHKRVFSKIRKRSVEEKERYVYNIEVEGNHNYFVNKFLVHNCDESAYLKDPVAVMNSIGYFITEGGCISMLSTPHGKNNYFYRVYSDREAFPGWHRHYVSLFKDMSQFDVTVPLQEQMQKYNMVLTCPWLNIDVLEDKRRNDAPFGYANFLEEVCCIPSDERSGAVAENVLNTNTMDYYDLTERKEDSIFVIGIDFGATNNVTACVVAEAKDGRFVICRTETYLGNVTDQIRSIQELVGRFSPKYVIGDATGLGGKAFSDILSEKLEEGIVVPVNYSKKDIASEFGVNDNNKNFMVNNCIKLLSEGLIIVPNNHKQLRKEILGVEKIVYDKIVKYSGKNGSVGSDDLAFAFFQLTLVYNRIYSIDQGEAFGSAPNILNKMTKDGRKERPTGVKAKEFVEISGASDKRYLDRKPEQVMSGFGSLI